MSNFLIKSFKNVFSSLFFILTLFFFVGACSPQKIEPPPAPSPPEWYIQNHDPQDGYLYGVGDSGSLARAKEKALREIAARIRISVESETENVTQKIGTTNSSRFKENIVTTVERINFSNAQTQLKEQVGNIYYVRMRISTEDLIQAAGADFKSIDTELNQNFAGLNERSKLEQFFILKKSSNNVDQGISLLLRLESLYGMASFLPVNAIDTQQKRQEYTQHRLKITHFLNEMNFLVVNDSEIDDLGTTLAELLSQEGIRVQGESFEGIDAVIHLVGKLQKNRIYDDYQVKSELLILIENLKKEVFQTTVFPIVSFSPNDYEDAIQRFSSVFSKKLRAKGTLSIFRLE